MKLTRDNILATIILLVMGVLMVTSALQDSATVDERAHIPAAYTYLKFQDMRLNPEHPPLLKDIAGLPLQFLDLKFDTTHRDWTDEVVGQWAVGTLLLYEWGNDADQIIFWSRIGAMLLTLLLGFYVYTWTNELAGKPYGLFALILYAFSPTILAHGRLVTTDIAAALGFVLGIYYFVRWLKHQTTRNFIVAGIGFGIAMLLKFSTVLLVPFLLLIAGLWVALNFEWAFILPFLTLFFWVSFELISRAAQYFPQLGILWVLLKLLILAVVFVGGILAIFKTRNFEELIIGWGKIAGKTLLVIAFGFIVVVWPVYAYHVYNMPISRQLRDTTYLLSSFADGSPSDHPGSREAIKETCLSTKYIKRCPVEVTIWMADKPYLRSLSYYALGLLMVIQRGTGGNTTYFLGEITNTSWPSYFFVTYLLKEQLVFHILTLLALGAALFRIMKIRMLVTARPDVHGTTRFSFSMNRVRIWMQHNFDCVALMLFVFIYFYISMRGNLNIGVRHLIPAITMLYILVAVGIARWLLREPFSTHPHDRKLSSYTRLLGEELSRVSHYVQKKIILVVLLACYIGIPLTMYPHVLSYFNVLGGGTERGYKYVVDSNYDWGQDLKRLARWVDEKHIDHIGIHYFGGGSPEYYIRNAEVSWWWDILEKQQAGEPLPKYLAVSASFVQYAEGTPVQGFKRDQEPWFPWVQGKRPIDRVGYSIFIYQFGE